MKETSLFLSKPKPNQTKLQSMQIPIPNLLIPIHHPIATPLTFFFLTISISNTGSIFFLIGYSPLKVLHMLQEPMIARAIAWLDLSNNPGTIRVDVLGDDERATDHVLEALEGEIHCLA